jgi:hypothetical protein
MKRILMAISMMMVVSSCGPDLVNGELQGEELLGTFKGVKVYQIYTPGGSRLMIGISENGEKTTSINYMNGKVMSHVIIIDGKKYVPAPEPENPFLK